MQEKISTMQRNIAESVAKHVVFEPWSEDVLKKAFTENNIDYNLKTMLFPNGNIDIIATIFSIIEDIAKEKIDYEYLESLKVREKIFYLVKLRIESSEKFKEALKTGISIFIPSNNIEYLKLIWHNADDIWNIAGDQSLDFNYYSKRFLLSKIYLQTMRYWFSDDSPNNEKTYIYLKEKIEEIIKFGSKIRKVKENCKKITKLPFIRLLFIK